MFLPNLGRWCWILFKNGVGNGDGWGIKIKTKTAHFRQKTESQEWNSAVECGFNSALL